MSPLEQRYRALLAWLPEPARSRWADDMTETFLTVATADDPEYAEFGSPTPADRLDVARLALRLRLGAPGASVRAVAAGRTVRLVALAGTVALASMALVALLTTAWVRNALPVVPPPDLPGEWLWGPREVLSSGLDLLTVALAVCVVRGLAAARWLAVLTLAGSVALTAGASIVPPVDLLPLLTAGVPLVAAALVPPEPAGRGARWLLALPALTVGTWVLAVGLTWTGTAGRLSIGWPLTLTDPAVQEALVLVVVGLIALRRRPFRGAVQLAVAVLGAALLPTLATRLTYDGAPAGWTAAMTAALLGTAVVTIATGLAGLRALHTLPADATAESSSR